MKDYALIGASSRALHMFAKPLLNSYSDRGRIVGIMDVNPLRAEAMKKHAGLECPTYTDFDRMVSKTKPDGVVITTIDSFHHEYIVRSLEAGISAITEKPMTIDAEGCNSILEAEKRTGIGVTVTFNVRFTPFAETIKKIVSGGSLGDILHVNYDYMIGTMHGSDYFHRWHRRKSNSGGLLVHKSSHHFDLVNWWLNDEPVEVSACGTRMFFTPNGDRRGARCLYCEEKNTCEYSLDLSQDELLRTLYLGCEESDGYVRDRCVFAVDTDIEDTMSATVRYSRGTMLSYSLLAYGPYSGFRVTITGTEGRLEVNEYYDGPNFNSACYQVDLYMRDGQKITYSVPRMPGNHDGGDDKLLRMLFEHDVPDPLGQQADSYAGALAVLIGVAANRSIAERRSVRLDELISIASYRRRSRILLKGYSPDLADDRATLNCAL